MWARDVCIVFHFPLPQPHRLNSPPQREDSPAIARLRSEGETILLFCRLDNKDPFLSCGRLRFVAIDSTERPLKLTFSLLDAPVLATSEHFAELRTTAAEGEAEGEDEDGGAAVPDGSENKGPVESSQEQSWFDDSQDRDSQDTSDDEAA